MNKKILIIGSRGFIGKQVVSAFKSEKNVQIFEGYKHNIDLTIRGCGDTHPIYFGLGEEPY